MVMILLSSCYNYYEHPPVIVGKEISNIPGITTYTYEGYGYMAKSFDDSTNKYNIGDTIK